jgi:TPR repeat protein
MKTKKPDILEADALKKMYEKGSFAPHSPEKIFNDSKYNYDVMKSAPFFGEETQGIYIKIYDKLGEMGYAPALYELGLLYFNGEWWLEQDLKKSLAYHKKAAELGNTDAMFELYVYYSTGQGGVKQDNKVALVWCEKAAEKNHYRACFNMASFYATGNGVKQDIDESVKWYERASKAGNGKASATLGVMYKMGQEIEGDAVKAEEYFKLAEEQLFNLEEFLTMFGIERYEEKTEKLVKPKKKNSDRTLPPPTKDDFKELIGKLCKVTEPGEVRKIYDAFYEKREDLSAMSVIENDKDVKLVEEWITLIYDRIGEIVGTEAGAELTEIADKLFN